MADGDIVANGWDYKIGKRDIQIIHSLIPCKPFQLSFYRRHAGLCFSVRLFRWQINIEDFT